MPSPVANRARARGSESGVASGWRVILIFALVTLVGVNLRTVILAVPPVLPLIQRDLGLSHTLIGFLTALPILLMASAALPSGLLASRIGGRWSVAIGLGLLALGAVLRAVWREAVPLYLFTVVLSAGIAIAQRPSPC